MLAAFFPALVGDIVATRRQFFHDGIVNILLETAAL
jgi:hypothetical protein